jgi:predicted nicotinamide N-methyase
VHWPDTPPGAPAADALARLLDTHTDFAAPALLPEIRVFQARSLVGIWEAAERLAGDTLDAPFWAYAWPAGVALARVLLDHAEWVQGARVLEIGAGGGVASLAAARTGAARVVANDIDPWALATTALAAARQALSVETLRADLTATPDVVTGYDVVLASDLSYERRIAPRQRALLGRARSAGARVLVADAGRTYFNDAGLTPIAAYTLPVPRDLEGVDERHARVFAMA